MPANIGEMFYFGDVPWHKMGNKLEQPADMEEAIKAGGLDWEVEMVPLCTGECPPSPVGTRLAIVRKDRKPGHARRVLGVAHKGFKPLQNREGIKIFDDIFGKSKRVYHTGGYLGSGEVIWLLAALDKAIEVASSDKLNTYALFTNSHDGSIAIDIRLTAVRVVCQNTLSLALKGKDRRVVFKRAHQGDYSDLGKEVESFFESTLSEIKTLESNAKKMLDRAFDDEEVKAYIESVFPFPKKPVGKASNDRAMKFYMYQMSKVEEYHTKIKYLIVDGLGTDLHGVQGSLWGAFNAVLEFVDHYRWSVGNSIAANLLGAGAAIKSKAYDLALKFLK